MNRLQKLLVFLVLSVSWQLKADFRTAQTEYEDPPNACYLDCTPWAQEVLEQYENAGRVQLQPTVFSGECHHMSHFYDPDHTHYSVVMLDRKPNSNEFYFSTQFLFFGENNEFADWTLEKSRQEMSDYWKAKGHLIFGKIGTRVEINYDDGNPAFIYWMRQNPVNGDLYYITYAGTQMRSFCRLQKHVN